MINSKLVIGFITFGDFTLKYLPLFLRCLKNQTSHNYKILAVDNTDNGHISNYDYISRSYQDLTVIARGRNIGFAQAYNLMINKALALSAEYFLALNPDLVLNEDAIEKMLSLIENDENLGSVSPKILKWDFKNKRRTNIIDSCGLRLLPGLRFIDIGQGQVDRGQYDQADILGPSGAAAMYRLSALEKIKDENGYFDENMFMYKEDCDLAYRLFLAGYKSKLIPAAIVYHDRTSSSGGNSLLATVINRKNKNKKVNQWSFLNQQIIFWKFWRTISFTNKLVLIWYQIKILFFIIFFEVSLLAELKNLYYLRKKLKIY